MPTSPPPPPPAGQLLAILRRGPAVLTVGTVAGTGRRGLSSLRPLLRHDALSAWVLLHMAPASACCRCRLTSVSRSQTLFKKMAQSGSTQPKKLTLEAGPMCFHYIIASNVAFLTLAERGYPKVTLQVLHEPQP